MDVNGAGTRETAMQYNQPFLVKAKHLLAIELFPPSSVYCLKVPHCFSKDFMRSFLIFSLLFLSFFRRIFLMKYHKSYPWLIRLHLTATQSLKTLVCVDTFSFKSKGECDREKRRNLLLKPKKITNIMSSIKFQLAPLENWARTVVVAPLSSHPLGILECATQSGTKTWKKRNSRVERQKRK